VSESNTGWETSGARDDPIPDVPNRMVILGVVLLGAFMILLDATIVNVAVPTIQGSLHATYSSIEWVLSGYALAYGLLLIPAGRLGDRVGHKKTYLVGLTGFTVASVLCGTAGSPGELVAWRVVQGAMAGVMNPPILAVIQAVFPPKERGKAFGLYGAIAGVATAIGPLAGGLLIAWNFQGWDWRPVFLVNLPIGILGLAAAMRLMPESRGRADSLDVAGIGLVSAAMLLITVPLIEGQGAGWPLWTFACLASALPVLGLFVLWERSVARHGRTPLVNIALFANRSFAAGTGVSLVYFAGFIGFLFSLSLYLQIGLGWSAIEAGLTILPFAAGTFFGAAFSDRVTRRIGRGVLQVGSTIAAISTVAIILLIHTEGVAISGIHLLPVLLVGGIGSGLVIAPNVDVVLSGVPLQDAGSASGVLNASQRLGQAVGIAVVGVALFASIGTGAATAASQASSELRQQLSTAGLSSQVSDSDVAQFSACLEMQLRSSDPTWRPPGCPSGRGNDPISAAFTSAARGALAQDFTLAVQVASLYALGAMVLTVFLTSLLPRRVEHQ
jgi:EmrB/QacA subfamily drug resistance transporter